MRPQFLWLLKPPSSISGRVLPNLGSANTVGSVNSKAIGIMTQHMEAQALRQLAGNGGGETCS